jgi:hypothetical protein
MAPVLNPMLEVGMAPLHRSAPEPPLAVHDVALVLDQASVAACPVESVVGEAVNWLTTAAEGGALLTLTMTVLGVLVPPGPVQVKV